MKNEEIDSSLSGTTCCLVIHVGTHIICANIGDSRALLIHNIPGNTSDINYWDVSQISTDHKPEISKEWNRIIMNKEL